jgi:phytoene dehydrogenase-like protein
MSSRDVLAECITDPVLSDMILCPVMFYGSAGEGDMPFADFALLFGSMFLEGLCRPAGGIVPLLERLRERLLESGAELVTGCGVEQLVLDGGAVSEVVLEDGRRMASDIVLSSAGLRETLRLCPTALPVAARAGRISVVEVILGLDCPVRDLGWERSVAFLSERNAFDFRCPGTLVDQSTGVVTAPGNFAGEGTEDDSGIHWLRLTRLASPELWLGEAEYGAAKHRVEAEIVAATAARMPGLEEHVVFRDCFTPRTIARFTGHENGALYGSPDKRRDGTVPGVRNLFLSGTDQGFLGVVGALMSGVAMANVHVLSAL